MSKKLTFLNNLNNCNISATRKNDGMILVSFDCYEIQLSNDTKTIRIGFLSPEKTSKSFRMSSFKTSNYLFKVRQSIWKITSNSNPDGLMGLLNYLDMHAIANNPTYCSEN